MKLGAKINLVLVLVTVVVLTVAFSVIVKIEAVTTRNQVINDAETSVHIFHSEIERMFKQIFDAQERLQNSIDQLSNNSSVVNVGVVGMSGVYIAATDHALVGTAVKESDIKLIEEIKLTGKTFSIRKDEGTFLKLEHYTPVRLMYGDKKSEIINIIHVEVATPSKNTSDVDHAQKLLQSISSSIERESRSVVVTREEGIQAIQAITDGTMNLVKQANLMILVSIMILLLLTTR